MTVKFNQKYQDEKVNVKLDFSLLISENDFIVSSVWTASTIGGIDPSPMNILVGPQSFTKNSATIAVSGGEIGATYRLTCEVVTSTGLHHILIGELEIKEHTPTGRQNLADYCLRALGAPLISIEISDEQVADRIEDAISYYHEYHFDGIERDYYVHKITGTQLLVASAAGFAVGDTISSLDESTTKAQIASISNNVITINRQIGYQKFQVNQAVKKVGEAVQTTITTITLGDTDNGWIPAETDIVGVKRILNVTNVLGSGDYIFNVQYQIMMSEIQNLTKAGVSYFYGVQQYLGHLDFIMKKEKDFRFNRRMNRLYLDISWNADVIVGDIVVAEVYRALDDVAYEEVLHDIWLRRYSTALLKKQWGSNLKKYSGMQLPGGLTYSGQQIYDEAIQEIANLENEAIYSTSPLEFMVG